jgi:hypothetical protein
LGFSNSLSPSLRAKRSNPPIRLLSHGLLRRFAPRNDERSHSRGADASEWCRNIVPRENRGRRECRALNRTRKPRGLKRKMPTSRQVRPKSLGTPCAMALRLTPRSPRCVGLSSHRRCADRSAQLDPSVEGTGPRGLTVRFGGASSAHQQRPSQPAPRVVTIGRTSLVLGRGGRIKTHITKNGSYLFLSEPLETDQHN